MDKKPISCRQRPEKNGNFGLSCCISLTFHSFDLTLLFSQLQTSGSLGFQIMRVACILYRKKPGRFQGNRLNNVLITVMIMHILEHDFIHLN